LFYYWTISVDSEGFPRAVSVTLLAEDDKETVLDITLPYQADRPLPRSSAAQDDHVGVIPFAPV
jgi:hypothetical protein